MTLRQDTQRNRGIVIKLTGDDRDFAETLGRERDDSMNHAGDSVAQSPDDRTAVHIRGAKAEVGVARYWGIDPHDKVGGPDDGVDYSLTIGGIGVDIDVKAKKARYWGDEELIAEPKHVNRVDVFVLTCVDGQRVRIVGYCRAATVAEYDTERMYSNTVYRVPAADLRPVPTPDEVNQQ